MLVNIRGAGPSRRCSTPICRSAGGGLPILAETTGASQIFDRNINSNTALRVETWPLPDQNVDSQARPNLITGVTLDSQLKPASTTRDTPRESSIFTMIPRPGKTSAASQEGTAVVKIYAQDLRSQRGLRPSKYRHQSVRSFLPSSGPECRVPGGASWQQFGVRAYN